MIDKIKKHWVISSLLLIIFVSLCYMTVTDTLSYPYILVSRQIQMLKYCRNASSEFVTKEYSFTVKVPDGYCFLPNRLFPDDGSVHILPKGLYSSINEYATGSVINNSKSTLLFEPIRSDRNIQAVLEALKKGGFMSEATSKEMKNKNGVKIYLVTSTKGVDESKYYNWAFIENKEKNVFLSILLSNTEDSSVFDYVLENIKAD